jgi:hypothetical protein
MNISCGLSTPHQPPVFCGVYRYQRFTEAYIVPDSLDCTVSTDTLFLALTALNTAEQTKMEKNKATR